MADAARGALRRAFPLVLAASFLAAPAAARYTSCPAGMALENRHCVLYIGDITRKDFSCASLKSAFGTMDCSKSASMLCGDWAVSECEGPKGYRQSCITLKNSLGAKQMPDACKRAAFTILDPQHAPKGSTAESAASIFSRKNNLSFGDRLALERAIRRKDRAVEGGRMSVPDGEVSLSSGMMKCLQRADGGYEPNGQHRIRVSGGRFGIAVRIRLNYQGFSPEKPVPGNEALVRHNIIEAEGCVENFFARHRIVMDLGLSFSDGSWRQMWEGADIKDINVYDEYPRSNSFNWGILKDLGKDVTPGMLCGTMVHEINHRLGLPDRYDDGPHTLPHIVPDYERSVQKHGDLLPIETLTLTDGDMELLFGGLCSRAPQPVPQPHPTPTPAPNR